MNKNKEIEHLIKYYERLIAECEADSYSNPSYLEGKITMAREFISDLNSLIVYETSCTRLEE